MKLIALFILWLMGTVVGGAIIALLASLSLPRVVWRAYTGDLGPARFIFEGFFDRYCAIVNQLRPEKK